MPLTALLMLTTALGAPAALSDSPSDAGDDGAALADYFGFRSLEVIRVDRGFGPVTVTDLNDDGLNDLVVVNNRRSRIELHYQKPDADPSDAWQTDDRRPNELPPHWRYNREVVSVVHEITDIIVHDFDDDGQLDLIYAAANPSEIVFVRQVEPGDFQVERRHRVRGIRSDSSGLAIGRVHGDDNTVNLLTLARGRITAWPLDGAGLGRPVHLTADDNLDAFHLADVTGNGIPDVVGVIRESNSPIRLWLTMQDADGVRRPGPQLRFEMPGLRALKPVDLPGEEASRIGAIERASRRMAFYALDRQVIPERGDREASLRIYGFTDPGNRRRDTAVVDVDGDGLLDLVATDTESNALVIYRQVEGKGLQPGESHPTLADVTHVVAGRVNPDDQAATIFVLSEQEGVVGRSRYHDAALPFPAPMSLPDGYTPDTMNLVEVGGEPHLAVIAKDGRDYAALLMGMDGSREQIELGSLSRSPETIVAHDADQDGRTDLLLLTGNRPMTMLYNTGDGFELYESRDMGQFGLVQAAGAENTELIDVDGNGRSELVIADRNFIRAVRYDPEPEDENVSPGWQVVTQVNADDSSAELVALDRLGDRIVAADRANERLTFMSRVDQSDEAGPIWREDESVQVTGFNLSEIYAGAFSGDGEDNILAISSEGFAVIRLAGERYVLREFADWVSDDEDQLQHELIVGDVNGDGLTNVVALDAGEQLCQIFAFDVDHQLHYATGFKTFESQMFTGGERREYEPRGGFIADITGDGANDLVLLAHDRLLIYPQMTEPEDEDQEPESARR